MKHVDLQRNVMFISSLPSGDEARGVASGSKNFGQKLYQILGFVQRSHVYQQPPLWVLTLIIKN